MFPLFICNLNLVRPVHNISAAGYTIKPVYNGHYEQPVKMTGGCYWEVPNFRRNQGLSII